MYEIKNMDYVLEKLGTNIYDFRSYLNKFKKFYEEDFIKLEDYWKGKTNIIDPNVLINFDYLYNEYFNLIFAFQRKTKGEIDLDFFELAEFFSDLKSHLDYIKNLPKYLKTSVNFVDVFEQPMIEYIVKDGDTLENIANKFYGDQEKFHLIMDYNNFDYYDVNTEGWIGRKIKIPAMRVLEKNILGIFDGLIGQNVLGKDIKSEFNFNSVDNENFDIQTVEFEECFQQGIMDIISEIEKGTVPEFPNIGNNIKTILGQNLGNLSYSMIINDLLISLKQEPTLKEVKITSLKIVEDKLEIEFSFINVLNGGFNFVYKVI